MNQSIKVIAARLATSANKFSDIYPLIENFIEMLKEEGEKAYAKTMEEALSKAKAGKPVTKEEFKTLQDLMGELKNQDEDEHSKEDYDDFLESLKNA